MYRVIIYTLAVLSFSVHAHVRAAAPPARRVVKPTEGTPDFWRTSRYCGVTSVYVMLRLHGIDLPYESVKDQLPVTGAGSNLEDMRLLLTQHGLRARAVKMNRQQLLGSCPMPCIAHIEEDGQRQFQTEDRGHFVVVLRADAEKGMIEAIDGTTAEIKLMPITDFLRVWTGYLLVADQGTGRTSNALLFAGAGMTVMASWWWFLRRARRQHTQVPKDVPVAGAVACLAVLLLLAGPVRAGDEVPSVDALKRELSERSSRLQSLYVQVKIVDELLADERLVREALNKAVIKDEVTTTAFKGEKRFSQRVAKRATVSADQEPPKVDEAAPKPVQNAQRQVRDEYEKMQQEVNAAQKAHGRKLAGKPQPLDSTSAFNGDELRTLASQAGHRSGSISPKKTGMQNQFSSLYFDSIGVYVEDPTANPEARERRRMTMLPAVLDRGGYQVTRDRLDGVDCLKIRGTLAAAGGLSFSDTMWLDPSCGLMLRQRVLADPKTEKPLLRTVNSEPKEVVAGLWLPMRCVIEEFAPPTSAASQKVGGPLLRTVLQVLKMEPNEVPDKLFELTFPTGTRIADFVAATKAGKSENEALSYVMPADASDLEGTIAEAMSRQYGGMHSLSGWRLGLIVVSLAMLVILGCAYFYKKRLVRS